MIIDKYFSFLRNHSCRYVKNFKINRLFKLKTQVYKTNSCTKQAHFDVLYCMLISAKGRLGLPSKYGRLISAKRRLMASGDSLHRAENTGDLTNFFPRVLV